jgi:alpha-tubulin suppressor-like RCC1 family protein
LGLGHTYQRAIPNLALVKDITLIASGESHNLVLDKNRRVWSFGSNSAGQLGLGTTVWYVYTPTMIESLENITTVYCGGEGSFVKDVLGQVWSFGCRRVDRTINVTNNPTGAPYPEPELMNTDIFVGKDHMIAIDELGNVFSSGSNNNGQLGQGDTGSLSQITMIRGFSTRKIVPLKSARNASVSCSGQDEICVDSNTTNTCSYSRSAEPSLREDMGEDGSTDEHSSRDSTENIAVDSIPAEESPSESSKFFSLPRVISRSLLKRKRKKSQ